MAEHSILIVHPDRKTQRTVQRILGVTGHRVDIADDLEQGIRLLQHQTPLLVVVDGSAATSPHGDAFFLAARTRGAEACMTLLSEDAAAHVPKIVGMGWAKHLILTGEVIDARQALAIGLVTIVTPAAQLQVRARELAKKILRQGPLAARLAKLALNASSRVDVDSGLLIETLAQAICYGSEDKLEGATAFLEKRKPKFTGR